LETKEPDSNTKSSLVRWGEAAKGKTVSSKANVSRDNDAVVG
jgi:hypothetical protein